MIYPEKIKKAVHFSSHKHKNQNRMIFDYPYITHPLMVFHLVSKFADDENILCAAILHDTVEDTDTSLRDIKENFGDEVHYLVDILSEDKSLEKIERKEKYYRRIFKENNKNIFLIKSADILYNVNDFIEDFEYIGKEKFLENFSHIELYVPMMRNILEKMEIAWGENPFLDDIHFYLNKLEALLKHGKLEKRIACGIIPIHKNTNKFLIITSQHGKVAFPKGHIEDGETFLETAERELFEETGLTCVSVNTENLITEQYIIPHKDKSIEKIVHYYIGYVDNDKVVMQDSEVKDFFWADKHEVLEKATYSQTKKTFKKALKILSKK